MITQTHLLQGRFGAATALGLLHAGEGQCQLHVLQHRLVGDEVVTLEYKADGVVAVGVPIAVLELLGGGTVNNQIALGIAVQTAHDVQQGGLTASGLTQDGHKLAVAEGEGNPVQCLHRVVAAGGVHFLNIFELQHNRFSFSKLLYHYTLYHNRHKYVKCE